MREEEKEERGTGERTRSQEARSEPGVQEGTHPKCLSLYRIRAWGREEEARHLEGGG